MSGPPWMPLYVRDYLADTGELTTLEHGAYLLLIMHYWQTGTLPAEDAKLANITKMRPEHWRKIRSVLEPLFGSGFRSHKRIDRELQRVATIREKRSAAARLRWLKSNAHAYAHAMHMDIHSQRKKDLTTEYVERGPVDKGGQVAEKGSAEEEKIQRIRARKT